MAATASNRSDPATGCVRVWDLPVRLCHWSFVALLPALWWTAENGQMRWHLRLGVVLLGLVAFRLLWGFFGSSTARFSQFVKGPAAVLRYLRNIWSEDGKPIGHNPAGGWSVVLLLGLLATQTTLGLFAGDPFDRATGPLNHLARVRMAELATEWHEMLFNVILAVVALHVSAIAFHALALGDNLIGPMVSGRRKAGAMRGQMVPVPAWRALACALLAGALAIWLHHGAPPL